jgi:acyl transferase domain-containing protein
VRSRVSRVFTPDHAARLLQVTKFDASLFGMSRMEAALTDPQHRQLLLGAWEAAEGAGYLGARPPRGTAYYCGTAMSTYYPKCASPNQTDSRRSA